MNRKSISERQVHNKEYDMVQYISQQFRNNNITEMSWKDFQKKFVSIAQRYSKLIQTIRNNKPVITIDDLDEWLFNYNHDSKYDVTMGTYHDAESSFRDAEQVVMQINRNANIDTLIAGNRPLQRFLEMTGKTAMGSGHPVKEKTVGWFRLDKINSEYMLIDEIQTDIYQAVDLTEATLTMNIGDLYKKFYKNMEEFIKQKYGMGKEQIINHSNRIKSGIIDEFGGGDINKAIETVQGFKKQLKDLFIDWLEDGMSTVIDYARDNGIKYVLLHTPETISERHTGVSIDKLSMYYTQTAKLFGFRKEHINMDDIKGEFFIREAKRVNVRGIKREIIKLIS